MALERPAKMMIRKLLTGMIFAVLVGMAGSAFGGEDVWRLAGTFNGWNTRDDAWQMTALPDGTYFVQAEFDAGRYEFKFVRNGDWGLGHFGSAGGVDVYALAEPGGNLVIDLLMARPVSFTLDPAGQSWHRGSPTVHEPVVVARLSGLPQIGLVTEVDLSETLLPAGTKAVDEFEIIAEDGERVRILPTESS